MSLLSISRPGSRAGVAIYKDYANRSRTPSLSRNGRMGGASTSRPNTSSRPHTSSSQSSGCGPLNAIDSVDRQHLGDAKTASVPPCSPTSRSKTDLPAAPASYVSGAGLDTSERPSTSLSRNGTISPSRKGTISPNRNGSPSRNTPGIAANSRPTTSDNVRQVSRSDTRRELKTSDGRTMVYPAQLAANAFKLAVRASQEWRIQREEDVRR